MAEIFGWFDEHNREQLEKLIAQFQVRTVLEIGSLFGLSAAWFAKRVEHVTCIDRWLEDAPEMSNNNQVDTLRQLGVPRDFYQVFLDNMAREGVEHKVTLIRGRSNEVADQAPSVDLVYIDADHSYAGCLSDIRLYVPKARKIICGDDYGPRPGYGVMEAVTEVFPEHKNYGPFWWREL
jgi:predicted O-methyltransferase YrrM